MYRIPFTASKSADQSISVLIPERMVINIVMRWNCRDSSWWIEVANGGRNIGPLRVVDKFPILYSHKALSPIEGDIIAVPLSDGESRDLADYNAFDDSWGLFWLSPEELKLWEKSYGLG